MTFPALLTIHPDKNQEIKAKEFTNSNLEQTSRQNLLRFIFQIKQTAKRK